MTQCRHKRTLFAKARDVEFRPDQEPFESGKVECAQVTTIRVPLILMHWCPKCRRVVSMDVDGSEVCRTDTCTSDDRCDGHE